MQLHHQTLSATDANQELEFAFDATSLLVNNTGLKDVFVNVSNTGLASASGVTNLRVRFGTSVTLNAGKGEFIRRIGYICAAAETTSLDVTASVR